MKPVGNIGKVKVKKGKVASAYVMKAYPVVEVHLHLRLMLARDGGE